LTNGAGYAEKPQISPTRLVPPDLHSLTATTKLPLSTALQQFIIGAWQARQPVQKAQPEGLILFVRPPGGAKIAPKRQ